MAAPEGNVRLGTFDARVHFSFMVFKAASRGGADFITVVMLGMAIARSRVTAQGQISIPSGVRKKLGIGPGSVLEWDEEGNHIVVRRASRFSSQDIHLALFGAKNPAAHSLDEMKEGVRRYVRRRYARG